MSSCRQHNQADASTSLPDLRQVSTRDHQSTAVICTARLFCHTQKTHLSHTSHSASCIHMCWYLSCWSVTVFLTVSQHNPVSLVSSARFCLQPFSCALLPCHLFYLRHVIYHLCFVSRYHCGVCGVCFVSFSVVSSHFLLFLCDTLPHFRCVLKMVSPPASGQSASSQPS